MNIPTDLKYSKNEEWIKIDGKNGTIGITHHAQEELSDIVYFEALVSEGDEIKQGDSLATVESVKAAADVFTPVSGTVVSINEDLADAPEKINADPYGAAWMVKITIRDMSEVDSLMDADAYKKKSKNWKSRRSFTLLVKLQFVELFSLII
jgi:glycine cleavage system H protein